MRQHFARIVLAAALCTFHFALTHAGPNTWTTSGPPGGFFRDLEQNSGIQYAAYGRSLFRTTDGGVTWQAKDFATEVVDITVDPTDGNRLYIAVLQDGVYRSADAGQTFTRLAPADSLVWTVGAGTGGTVYYGTGNGSLYRSTNGGDSFSLRTASAPITLTNLHVYSDVIAAIQGPSLALSTDAGASWTTSMVDGSSGYIQSFTRLASGTFVVTMSSGVFTSPTGAAPWTKRIGGGFYAATPDPTVAGAFFATNVGVSPLWYFTNEGANITTVGTAPPLGTPSGMLIVQGVASRRFILANSNGVQFSTDAGATWTESSSGPIASAPSRLATTQAVDAKVYAFIPGSVSGLFSTLQDSGWQRLNLNAAQAITPNLPFGQAALAVQPGMPLRLYMGQFNAGMFRSNDGGSSWSGPGTGLSGLSASAIAFDPANPDIMYSAVSQASSTPTSPLYKSVDQGATWTPFATTGLPVLGTALRLLIDPADNTRMFLTAVAQNGNSWLYRSKDGGASWSAIISNDAIHDVVLDPSNSNIVYAAGGRGLYVSSNGGDSFAINAALTAITAQAVATVKVDPLVPTTIYAATVDPGAGASPPQSSFILRSVDRGQTWEKLRTAADQPAWFVDDLLLDPNRPSLLYVTTAGRGIGTYEIVNDLALSITGHSGMKPRGLVSTLDVNVLNNGALSGTDVHVNVQLPAGLTNVSATVGNAACTVAGSSVQCVLPVVRPAQTISAHVTYTPPGDMSLPVTASVTAVERDGVATNNSAQASATAGEVVDLRVTVLPSTTSVNTGSGLSYTVQVSNAGPLPSSSATLTFGTAAGISLDSTLPSGCSASSGKASCTLAGLAVSASQTLSFSATASTAGSNVATATVAAATTASDADPSNNTATATVVVSAPSSGGGGGASGGGGGGAVSDVMLALLSLLLAARLWRIGRRSDSD